MRLIEIEALPNGAHQNQFTQTVIEVPEGWAVIPDDMAIPETFPFVRIVAKNGKVTSMVAGTMPEPEPVPEPETADDILNALLGVSE